METTFSEIKSTMLGGRVLRSRTVGLVEQEIYALLISEQLLRTAMSEVTNAAPDLEPDRANRPIPTDNPTGPPIDPNHRCLTQLTNRAHSLLHGIAASSQILTRSG
ncbi:hypothetical protein GCM10027562_03740 [Arthrobacter pigmenti]